ncbi:hypothetical protein D3C74_392180 [compost metagenome]
MSTRDRDLTTERVQADSASLEHRRPGREAAPVEGAEPGDELGELERLGQIVVGAEAEPVHTVVEGARCCEHQHRGPGRVGRQAPADLVPVHAGDVPVEQYHVVVVQVDGEERRVAVRGHVGRDRLHGQTCPDGVGQVLLVLHDQHSHVRVHLPLVRSAVRGASPTHLPQETTEKVASR